MSDGGSHSGFGGGAPRPEPEQVATARFAILDDAESCNTFAGPIVERFAALNDAVSGHAVAADPGICSTVLRSLRERAASLDPDALTPRGLFDSRSRRLKDFRDAYARVAASADETIAALTDYAGRATDTFGALERLFTEAQEIVTALDAHIAAATAWLGDHLKPTPDTTEAPTAHPLEARAAALAEDRRSAVALLPRLRALQNADGRTAPALKAAAEAIDTWRADWGEVLGLAGKRPKSVKPDPGTLAASRDALIARLSSAETTLAEAAARRAEIEGR